MADITEFLWDDHDIAHFARHKVIPADVSEVVFAVETLFFDVGNAADRPGRLVAFGETEDGRVPAVYLDTPVGGRSYPATVRPMTANDERSYRRARGAKRG